MSANTAPIYPQTPIATPAVLNNASGTSTKVAVLTAGTNGTRLDSLHLCLDDTVAATITFWLNVSSTDYLVGGAVVAAGAGNGVVNFVEGLASLNAGNALVLPSGSILKALVMTTAITAGKTLTITPFGGNY